MVEKFEMDDMLHCLPASPFHITVCPNVHMINPSQWIINLKEVIITNIKDKPNDLSKLKSLWALPLQFPTS